MQAAPLPTGAIELDAALLQATITAALAALCAFLFGRYRKPYFAWWAAAWGLYFLRIGAITSFLLTAQRIWLYWHQVVTGWTALALLYAALVFSQQVRWRPWYLALVLFPPVWSYVAIYRLDHFLWAAGPAVLFLSLATLWTGWVFLRYRRRVARAAPRSWPSPSASGVSTTSTIRSFARAGAWAPWGYYLDILLALAVGAGILLLVLDDLRRGLSALSALSGDLQRAGREQDVLDALLARPLTLAGRPRQRALPLRGRPAAFVRGAGVCERPRAAPRRRAAAVLTRALRDRTAAGHRRLARARCARPFPTPPCCRCCGASESWARWCSVGDARDPFTALDDRFLVALGQQVGAALENADLYTRLQARTVELARLSARMVEQHEEERRRLSRELHDETAQVFSAVKMELGVLRDGVAAGAGRPARLTCSS